MSSKNFSDINLAGPSLLDDPMKDFKPQAQVFDEPKEGLLKETFKMATEEVLKPTVEEKKPSQEVIQTPKVNPMMEMEISENGKMLVSTMSQKVEMIKAAIKGNMLPKRYTEVGAVLSALQYSTEIGMGGTLCSLKNIAVVEGTPTLFNEAPLALVLNSGKLEYIKEFYLDKEQKKICMENGNMFNNPEMAVCEVKRVGDVEPLMTFFSMNDAAKAGLSGRGVWSKYPKIMMKYRSRAEALKGKFAEITNGLSIGEYDFDATNEKECEKEKPTSTISNVVFGEPCRDS